jgi:hypothetical protein
VALAALAVAVLDAGCRGDRSARVRVWVARLPKDTVRFEAPARARRCSGGRGGVLLQGASGGNGVAVWLRSPDAIASGPWPLLQRGDTVTPRGAIVGVRYNVGDYAHGAPLDSGAVRVTRTGDVITLVARGGGLDGAAHGRLSVEATFEAVPLAADTVSCRSGV